MHIKRYFFRMVPESVRWLLANDKQEKAKQIICKAAKVNNVILSSNVLDALKEVAPLHVNYSILS